MLVGGVLSDRISPRDLALVSNVLRAVLTTVVAGLVLGGRVELWQLAAVGVVFGTVDAVFLPAINTLVPRLVPADRLAAANAVMQAATQLVGTVGPAIAGFAVALVGVGAAFGSMRFVRGGGLCLVAGACGRVRPRRPPDAAGRGAVHPTEAGSVPRHRWLRCREGARSPGRPGHALDRHPVDRRQPGLHRTDRRRSSVAGPHPFGRDASSLGLLFAAFGAGVLAGVLVAGSVATASVRLDRARAAALDGRRSRCHRPGAVDPPSRPSCSSSGR